MSINLNLSIITKSANYLRVQIYKEKSLFMSATDSFPEVVM